ncbi:cdc42-interacting protein 4-like isoform X2 [Rhinatrema bivittatum]|uniref:cdc42-interacting protein 4-like isoform X2 n=1 Tax=Rhinatrema bivittatum TaxID=194408 RepID=UPI00112C8342|nr:cdc42-interacting protein 4-like isoform X2 [Rhinatrema bivittatum]
MDWGSELWDQFDTVERHTQWGLELVEKYVKFVRDRTEIEQCYAKQLRNLVKKYLPKRNSREDPEFKYSQYHSFQQVIKELSDFAGQREVVAETLMLTICVELVKYSQEIKHERKTYLQEGRRAQQQLEGSLKQLESSKRKFERDCREAEKAALTAEKLDQDINATKADVEKAKQQANLRSHMAEESKNDYASCLQKFNQDQSQFYFTQMPQIYRKLQEMDERRTAKLKEGYSLFSDAERQVLPIIGKCLDGMKLAADSVNEKHDSQLLIEMHKSGFERPGDVEFEDFSETMNRTSSDSSLGTPKGTLDTRGDNRQLAKSKGKRWPFLKKYKLPPPPLSLLNSYPSSAANGPPSPRFSRDPLSYCLNEINKTMKPRISSFRTLKRGNIVTEDFSHLPPEQRRKKLQQKIEEKKRDLQKETDQRDALHKMKDVYQKSPQMGNPNSLEPKITETLNDIDKLQQEIQKYESWLSNVESRMNSRGDTITRYTGHSERTSTLNNSTSSLEKDSPETPHSDDSQDPFNQPIYTEFDEDFEEEAASPIGQCTALYSFEGSGEGTIAMSEGEELSLMEEDKGDGWTRVRKSKGAEGYVPTSYVQIHLK